ncbi:MaoC family dehydratase [Devriesea agamarum]|uniref:MaoC family dehydratase n=1 Tax=Devriesea agamarum TaxID=472569 RepID=UPI00071CE7E0|nr:MaoC family dehydratase [Devriesea agamarum]
MSTNHDKSVVVLEDLEVGAEIGRCQQHISRADLVRYAGASGDFNPIHYNDAFAQDVGLPGVIAHGMLTMGRAITLVLDWIGDPGAICEYGVRFTRPVPVPALGEAVLDVVATIGAIDLDASTARVDLTVSLDERTVLGRARTVVAVPRREQTTGLPT